MDPQFALGTADRVCSHSTLTDSAGESIGVPTTYVMVEKDIILFRTLN